MSLNPRLSCFADEQPSWISIASIEPIQLKYEAIVNKLRLSFGCDKKTSMLYIDIESHNQMFSILLKCMEELDSHVNNHDYDPSKRDTKNIKFARDIVKREFHLDKIPKKADQRLILFETACVILLSMNNNLIKTNGGIAFPKYNSIESFLFVYPHYSNLSAEENNQYLHFANYTNVTLRFLRGTNNEKHVIPIGLRIVAGRGVEFITGGGKTDKTKRRKEILKTEANEPISAGPLQQIIDSFDLNDIDTRLFLQDFAVKVEDELDIELGKEKSRNFGRTIAGVNIITNVVERETPDGNFNFSYHETRIVDNDDNSTTISRSVSLTEKWKDGDDNFNDEIAWLNCDKLENGTSLSTNVSRKNNYIVKTTSINLKNSTSTSARIDANLGQKRAADNTAIRSISDMEFPSLMRSISELTYCDPEEYELMRSTSNVNDLVLNHLNMTNLTDDIFNLSDSSNFPDFLNFDNNSTDLKEEG